MATKDEKDWLEDFQRHLNCPEQNWLLGAGTSFGAKIPLMWPLTDRVMQLVEKEGNHFELLSDLKKELPEDTHVEHFLSHLGDYSALAERSKEKTVTINNKLRTIAELADAHNEVLKFIADTIRYGYVQGQDDNEEIGTKDKRIVKIDDHLSFVSALFDTAQAGLHDRRKPVRLFTINYDTLLEDALALGRIPYWDGFSSGSIAYRNHRYGQEEPSSGFRALLIKLHGSIDWFQGEDGEVWRVREYDNYPPNRDRVLIYPQANKYIATQRDPFSSQFDLFRRALCSNTYNILGICGYSLGDEHINQEIEIAMSREDSKTTLLIFCKEHETDGLSDILNQWRSLTWGNRVFIATQKGLYVGNRTSVKRIDNDEWWSFLGLINVIKDGVV